MFSKIFNPIASSVIGPSIKTEIFKALNENEETLKKKLKDVLQVVMGEANMSVDIGLQDTSFKLALELVMLAAAVVKSTDWIQVSLIVIPYLMNKRIDLSIANDFLKSSMNILSNNDATQQAGNPNSKDCFSLMYDKITKILFTFISLITDLKMPKLSEVLKFCRNAHFISSGINGVKNIWEYIQFFFSKFMNWSCKKIFGHSYDENYDLLTAWLVDIKGVTDYMRREPNAKKILDTLNGYLETGLSLQSLAYKMKMRPQFDMRMQILRSAISKAESGVAATESIVPPFLIYLYGGSGVGKSTLITKLASEFIKVDPFITDPVERIDKLSEVDKYIYHRNSETQYFDGLSYDHFIMVYDDIFQNIDSKAKPNIELMELIRSVGSAPMLPHMAAVGDKGKFNLHNRLLICTSNVRRPQPLESIADVNALYRRINHFKILVSGTPNAQIFQVDTGDENPLLGEKMNYEQFSKLYRIKIQEWVKSEQKVKAERNEWINDTIITMINENIEKGEFYPNKMNVKADVHAELDSTINLVVNLPPESKKDESDFEDALSDSGRVKQQIYDIDRDILQDLTPEQIKKKAAADLKENRISFITLKNILQERFKMFSKNFCYTPCENKICTIIREIWESNKTLSDTTIFFKVIVATARFTNEEMHESIVCCGSKILDEYSACSSFMEYSYSVIDKIRDWLDENPFRRTVFLVGAAVAVGSFVFAILDSASFFKKLYRKLVNKCYLLFNKKKIDKLCIKPENVDFYYINNNWVFCFRPAFRQKHNLDKLFFPVEEYLEFPPLSQESSIEVLKKHISTEKGNYVLAESAGLLIKYLDGHGLTQERVQYGDEEKKKKWSFSKPTYLSQEACSDSNFIPIRNKFEANIWHIFVNNNEKTVRYGNVLGYKGKVFISFGHLLHALNKLDVFEMAKNRERYTLDVDKIKVIPLFNEDTEIPANVLSQCRLMSVKEYCEFQDQNRQYIRDSALLVVPDFKVDNPDLSRHIITFDDIKDIVESEFQLVNYQRMDKVETCTLRAHFGSDVIDNVGKDSTFALDRYFEYTAVTQDGSCGSPLYNLNPKIARKFCGMHVAGYEQTNRGLAVLLYKEIIDKALSYIPNKEKIGYHEMSKIEHKNNFVLQQGLHYRGHLLDRVQKPVDSQYMNSKICGVLNEPRKEIMKLGIWNDENGVHDPYLDGIIKYSGISPDTLPKYDIMNSFFAIISSKSDYKAINYKRIFSVKEAVFGIPKLTFFKGINRNSSPGYGWSKHGLKGKQYWIQGEINSVNNPPYINSKLYARIEQRILLARQNIKLETLYILTAKDEKKKIGGTTRLFTNPPMDYTIACRMYFGAFINWFIENQINNHSLIGMNMYGTIPDYMGRKFEVYKNIIAGDFTNYDGHERADVLLMVLDFIERWYNGSQEDKQIRYILYKDLVNSYHICWDFIYQIARSVPSGNPLTSIVNTLYNMILNIYVYLMLVPVKIRTVRDYFHNVWGYYYGDDHVIGVKNRVKQYLTYNSFCTKYKELGHVYTTSHKDKIDDLKEHDNINDVVILKRVIVFDQYVHRYIACLEKKSIEETINWCKIKNNTVEQIIQNVDFVLRESSLWDKEYYDHVVDLLSYAFDDLNIFYMFEDYYLLRDKILSLEDVAWGDDFSDLTGKMGVLL